MFDLFQFKPKIKDIQHYRKDHMHVMTAAELLSDNERSALITRMKKLIGIRARIYDNLSNATINRFAEFVQNLPKIGSKTTILTYALERAILALEVCLKDTHPVIQNINSAVLKNDLWLYAIFTAVLFYDIGVLVTEYTVDYTDRDSDNLLHYKRWHPFKGSMLDLQAKYYIYSWSTLDVDRTKNTLTILLATRLMAEGFNWISEDSKMLENWLGMLEGGTDNKGNDLAIAMYAESLLINRKIMESFESDPTQKITHSDEKQKKSSQISEEANRIASQFVLWTKHKIEHSGISVNVDGGEIQSVNSGLLLSDKIFKDFTKNINKDSYEQIKHMIVKISFLAPYFQNIGILENSFKHNNYSSNYLSEKFSLLVAPYLLFAIGKVPAVNTSLIPIQNQNQGIQNLENTLKPKPIPTN